MGHGSQQLISTGVPVNAVMLSGALQTGNEVLCGQKGSKMAFCMRVKSLILHISKCQARWNIELKRYKMVRDGSYRLGCHCSENDTYSDSFVLNSKKR